MNNNKKIIIGIFIIILIIVIGIVVAYKLIENSVTNRENLEFNVENINSIPIDTENLDESEHSFFGKVIESASNYIIVEPNEDEKIRKSSDKISIGLGEKNDVLYMIGTNVKITYDGIILDSYPAEVNATNIEIKSVDKFSLVFTETRPKQKEIIISKGEIKDIDYNVYAYEGSVAINLNSDSTKLTENSISLRDALLQNKITMDEIISKANKDFPDAEIYEDGGSMEYHYENYTIIKCHRLDGNKDVYIGTKEMTLNDII